MRNGTTTQTNPPFSGCEKRVPIEPASQALEYNRIELTTADNVT